MLFHINYFVFQHVLKYTMNANFDCLALLVQVGQPLVGHAQILHVLAGQIMVEINEIYRKIIYFKQIIDLFPEPLKLNFSLFLFRTEHQLLFSLGFSKILSETYFNFMHQLFDFPDYYLILTDFLL